MSKQENPIVLGLTLLVTLGLIGGGLWWLNRSGVVSGAGSSISSARNNNASDRRESNQLKILGDTFSGYSTFRNSEFQEALAQTGLKLAYEDEFDQGKRAERLSRGEVDLMMTTLDRFVQEQPAGKIIGLIDRTTGADAVVLNTPKYPELQSLEDLKALVDREKGQGKTLDISFAGDTPSEYLALVLDTKFEAFNLSDFQENTVADASEAWELLQDKSQDLPIAVIWEPYVTQARQQGYTVVLSSQDAPNAIVDVLVANDRLIESQPDAISDFLEAYYRRIDTNVRDASQLQTQIAEDGGLEPADAAAVLDGIEFFTAAEAQKWMTEETLAKRISSTAAVLVLSGRLDKVPENPEDLIVSSAIAPAAQNTQTLIDLVRDADPQLAERLAGDSRTITPTAPNISQEAIAQAPSIGNLQVRGEVKFESGAADLTGAGQDTLENLAQEISEFNVETVAVQVIGHTSKTGVPQFNQTLSEQRAQTVVDYLQGAGLQHNFVAEGKGFYLPLSGVPPEDPRQQRTEIRLVRIN
ncbi:OmpA family protein [Oscillatoriales cyanobacterium LEGE 11467]|uniref:OmpA family protein n=1 Tax=Zarconia navalis LEGE 11467 TaxID=1828826 RepID=A0A928VZT6_9CYAN|nr:phosphate ABC transporter substrate-binding/OmpA family protein [Zarconia navalis]MBE9041867.1 OmpA family protein [Zarconia navalis LEGE 11467]